MDGFKSRDFHFYNRRPCVLYDVGRSYTWLLQCRLNGSSEWEPRYGFTLEEQFDADFIPNSYYCETHPESNFRGHPRVSIIKPDCCMALNGNELRRYFSAECTVTQLPTRETLEAAILEHFGVKFREAPAGA